MCVFSSPRFARRPRQAKPSRAHGRTHHPNPANLPTTPARLYVCMYLMYPTFYMSILPTNPHPTIVTGPGYAALIRTPRHLLPLRHHSHHPASRNHHCYSPTTLPDRLIREPRPSLHNHLTFLSSSVFHRRHRAGRFKYWTFSTRCSWMIHWI